MAIKSLGPIFWAGRLESPKGVAGGSARRSSCEILGSANGRANASVIRTDRNGPFKIIWFTTYHLPRAEATPTRPDVPAGPTRAPATRAVRLRRSTVAAV